ncbi:MAG: UDP-N-acetylmuramoyl-tripeptide--D-alanyl-D-alanine ligase [Ignavibacteriales bacterium]
MNSPKINIEDLFNLPGAVIYNPDTFSSSSVISTDTRTIKKNSVFVAIKGKKFDGHKFVSEAVKKGASAVIVNKNRLKDFDNIDITIVAVKNTLQTYGDLGRIWRDKLNAKIVAITGSNGKTTTKEILAKLLEEKFSVAKTLANNNNNIGVPLTLFSTDNSKDVLVLELGTNHFGEIAFTSEVARPDYALITNIGESHLEFLHDLEGVAGEKLALFDATSRNKGKIFVNTDDKLLKKKTKQFDNIITFGFNGSPDIKGNISGYAADGKTILEIIYKNKSFKVVLPVYGLSNAKNFLAASAIALVLGETPAQIKKAAGNLKAVDKRLNVKTIDSYVLVDDTYNANPLSMRSAFEFLKSFNGKRKVAVLGDMFELGKEAVVAHKALAADVKKNKIDEVYTIGKLMKNLHDDLDNGKVKNKHFNSRNSLKKFLELENLENAVVLVKGSRGMKMEEFVKIIEGKK